MLAQATETQTAAIRLLGLDYDVKEIRVYLKDSDDNVQQVAEDTSSYAQGDDVTLHFVAPEADTYDIAIKADLTNGDTRTIFQGSNAFRSNPDFGT